MEWVRGEAIGRGSFGAVNLAVVQTSDYNGIPPLMAVKSAGMSQSASLQKEKKILTQLRDCPQVISCFGDDLTVENGETFYNVFLEYASRGNLADLVRNSCGGLVEFDVRRYTRSILEGLCYIHKNGYVHCDIKLQNILVCSSPDGSNSVKIADFGLAKKNKEVEVCGFRGTPLCMSPESVARNEQEAPSDIWSLGCVVAELMAGKPAWRCRGDSDVGALLFRIGFGEELPEIPGELSEQGKDFLRRCFVRDASKRWTAEMLLNHPFVADESILLRENEKASTSPRSAFDFPDWNSENSSPITSSSADSYTRFEREFTERPDFPSSQSPALRFRQLVTQEQPSWSSSDTWVTVR